MAVQSFNDAPVKSIPLSRDPSRSISTFPGGPSVTSDTNLFQISLNQEKDLAKSGANDTQERHPRDPDVFSVASNSFNSPTDRVESITHARHPTTNALLWYAIVRPVNGSDQIWTSNNKIDWNRMTIAGVPSGQLRIKTITSSSSDTTDAARLGGLPVVCAVGITDGHGPTILRSLNMESFQFIGNPLYDDGSYITTTFEDAAYGNGGWVFTTNEGTYLRNSDIDVVDADFDWDTYTGAGMGSITYGNGVYAAANETLIPGSSARDNGILVSTDGGVTFVKSPAANSSKIIKIRYTDGYWVAVGRTVTSQGSILYSDSLDTDINSWSSATITQNSYPIIDADFGAGFWYAIADIPPSDSNSNRIYYTNGSIPNTFYNDQTLLPSNWSSKNLEYGGGVTQEWLITSQNSSDMRVNDIFPAYSGIISPLYVGTSTHSIGSIGDTYYDSSGTLVTTATELWQYSDSTVSYKSYFQNAYGNTPIFIATDSDGDIWEMDSDNILPLISRTATFRQLYQYASTFRLEQTEGFIDSFNPSWEYWLKDIHFDTQSVDSSVGYSIYRKTEDPETFDLTKLLKLVGQDSTVLPPDGNPTGTLGIQDFGEGYAGVSRKLLQLGYEIFDIGEAMILVEPEEPTDPPYNRDGSWKKRGFALDTREDSAGSGNFTEIDKYNFWVKVSDIVSGSDIYVDSDYFTPEGKDSGYVFP